MILELHQWRCDTCEAEDKTLHVHHKYYKTSYENGLATRAEPWDYDLDDFRVLCAPCHEQTEIALMELRRVFGGFDHFQVSAFAQDFENACIADNPLAVLDVMKWRLGMNTLSLGVANA